MNDIAQRLVETRDRIARAARQCGREPGAVTLLAVSKTKPESDIRAAFAAGQRDFGENYLQEALPKIKALADLAITWHYIGRIQGNKTGEIAAHFDWVHGLDQLRHAERLSRQRGEEQAPLQVCIQVNLSGEQSKGGVAPEQLPALAGAVAKLPALRLRGLMTMPDPASPLAEQAACFRGLAELAAELPLPLDTLSMGMSADLEQAIAAGSTMVRIGTAIFGAR